MIFLNLLHMRDIHSDFQPAIFKTVNYSVMGAILPPGYGGWGRGVEFPRSASYDKHTLQFSASYLHIIVVKWGRFYPLELSLGEGGWGWGVEFL